jgi:hypothetical protein
MINYEAHVSVLGSPERFHTVCADLGVRPVHAHNLMPDGGVSSELLTVSTGRGSPRDGLTHLQRVANDLRLHGLKVVREKLEVDPRHPSAPTETRPASSDYMEAHLRVCHGDTHEAREAVINARTGFECELFVSWDTFKAPTNGHVITMLTVRSFTLGVPEFVRVAELVHADLSMRWSVGPLITEWAVFDNNIAFDSAWLPLPDGLRQTDPLELAR